MTVEDVLELRRQGLIEEAYENIRVLYAHEKDSFTSMAMFWVATDILKKRLVEKRLDEANKVFLALQRMQERLPHGNGLIAKEMDRCRSLVRERLKHDGKDNSHLMIGRWGEDVAADYLLRKGYEIIQRDWHSGHRDIDIIASKEGTMVFVEVKTRSSRELLDPVMAVGYNKQKNVLASINHYIKYTKVKCPVRFDVITVVGKPDAGTPEIEHIKSFRLLDSSI